MANHGEIVSFIWGVADLIRDSFKRGHYQDVILPFTVLRRIDAVLAPTKQKVLDTYNKLKDKLDNLEGKKGKTKERAAAKKELELLKFLKDNLETSVMWSNEKVDALLSSLKEVGVDVAQLERELKAAVKKKPGP